MNRKFELRPIARILAGVGSAARSAGNPLGTMLTCMALAPVAAFAQAPTPAPEQAETTLPEVKVTSPGEDFNASGLDDRRRQDADCRCSTFRSR